MVDGHARGVRVSGPDYHGKTHQRAPIGSDPIPGLVFSAVGAIASLHTLSSMPITAGDSGQMISMEDGLTGGFDTSDPSVFANAPNGASVWGIQVLKSGTVRFDFDCRVIGGSTSVEADAYQSTDFGVLSFWQAGRTGGITDSQWDAGQPLDVTHISWSERVSFDSGDVPSVTVVFNGLGGVVDAVVDWAVWAVYESDIYLPGI